MPKKPRKPPVPKPYNGGTMTSSAFWSFIKSALRQKSRWWKPVREVKLAARRPSQSSNTRLKWEFCCAQCHRWLPDKEISVDHKIPVGSLKGSDDLAGVVARLFCEKEGLQCLCDTCHGVKTKQDLVAIRA